MSENQFLEQLRSNQGIIYKLVALYACDAEEKKDLYQEIVLQAWKSWPSFRNDSRFSTWLYRICLNTIFTQRRKKHPVDYKESLEAVSPAVQSHSRLTEEAERLQWAIRQLEETDRAIISMHLDGYDNAGIAAVIGISLNHVGVKLYRIKQQLGNLLKSKL